MFIGVSFGWMEAGYILGKARDKQMRKRVQDKTWKEGNKNKKNRKRERERERKERKREETLAGTASCTCQNTITFTNTNSMQAIGFRVKNQV
ncbi:MAG: hypothetical protein EOM68_06690 [Spirochaetia bacterium]|nr:hypothetical protein [Spirochaetia bacterium]